MSKPMIPISKTDLIKEWDFERNTEIGLDPNKITTGMVTKAYWKCPKCGYSWKAVVQIRAKQKSGCRVCKGLKVLPGYNDLMTKNPKLMTEWDFERNNAIGLFPYNVGPGTIKKAWWKCPKGHPSYYAAISSRTGGNTRQGTGCAVCANKKVLPGVNDLATTKPELLKLWNYEKNNEIGITPDSVTEVSGKKAWWKCEKGHEWFTTIAHITYGRRCPQCNCGRSTSFPEQAIFYYLKKMDTSCINRYRLDNNELDIFIPSKNVGIEYNGYRWHDEEKSIHDHFKREFFEEHGIKVISVVEVSKKNAKFGSMSLANHDIYYVNDDDDEGLADTIMELVKDIFDKDIAVDIDTSRPYIYESYHQNEESWSFANDDTECFFKWDYEKNGSLRPEHVARRSGKIVYWLCPEGHSFRRSVHTINSSKSCPICAKKKVYDNRFELTHPELLNEWDYEKNISITPDEVTCGSSRKIWWKCKEGHPSWAAPIPNRIKGCGCPICGRKKVQMKRYKRVAQYDLNGNFIREWDGMTVAQNALNIKHIASVCNGQRKTAGGFIWKYVN